MLSTNTITLPKGYTEALDEVYQKSSVTSDLTCANNMVKAGANAGEIVYPQISVSGLGDYDRNSGYTTGAVDLKWETAKCNYDRGTKITVDAMDNQESEMIAFSMAGAELMRTKVAQEADAFTFATIASTEGISVLSETSFENAVQFLEALITAKTEMDNNEVPAENRLLYATSELMNAVIGLDTTKSREILAYFQKKIVVPQSRFYTGIDLLDGKTPGEELGHYRRGKARYEITKDTDVVEGKTYYTQSGSNYIPVKESAKENLATYYEMVQVEARDINFMIIHKPAVMKYDKHIAKDIIPASMNSDADADILKYRKYGMVDVYKNKRAGIYLCTK